MSDRLDDKLDRSLCGAMLIQNQTTGSDAHLTGGFHMGQQIFQDYGQIRRLLYNPRRVRVQKQRDDIFKIVSVRTEQNGCAIPGRFNHILTTSTCQAATDEGEIRQTPTGGEFT